MTFSVLPANSRFESTVDMSAPTKKIVRPVAAMPDPDNLTTTRPIARPSVYDPVASKLHFIYQGIKGARFLMFVMLFFLTIFLMGTATELTWQEWLVASGAQTLLGLGIWVSFFDPEETVGYGRTHRRLTVYFAVCGTLFTVLTFIFRAIVWWKMTGTLLP